MVFDEPLSAGISRDDQIPIEGQTDVRQVLSFDFQVLTDVLQELRTE